MHTIFNYITLVFSIAFLSVGIPFIIWLLYNENFVHDWSHLPFKKKISKKEFGDLRRKYKSNNKLSFFQIEETKDSIIYLVAEDEYGDITETDIIGYYRDDEQIFYYGNPLNEICKELEIY